MRPFACKETETTRLNERKFQVRGTLCITITEIRKAELHVLRDAADPDLILRQDSMSAADLVFETEEFADVEQEIAVEEGQPRPARILKESFAITETHRQVTSGKLIINGMLQTQILYLGEDDEGGKAGFAAGAKKRNSPSSSLCKVRWTAISSRWISAMTG